MDDYWKMLIPAIGATLAALVSLFVSHRTIKHAQKSTIEGVSLKLLDRRIEPYTAFMAGLAPFSKQAFLSDRDEGARQHRATAGVQYMDTAIYGALGLLASYETREVLVCTRSRLRAYARGSGDFESMMQAIWGLHQLLRADLNLRQPGMRREIESIHTHVKRLRRADIIGLLAKVPHIDWERTEG